MEKSDKISDTSELHETFHKLEIKCVGYENFIDCEEKNYLETLEQLRLLIKKVAEDHMFSQNETIDEVQTENLKLLMIPYYQADTLLRIMDKRLERVQMANLFYMDYLKMLGHYNLLSEQHKKMLKTLLRKKEMEAIANDEGSSRKDRDRATEYLRELKVDPFADREAKVAEYRMKKDIESQLTKLKDHRDEELKRQYYMTQLQHSVIQAFGQINITQMELQMLEHASKLTPEQKLKNEQDSMRKPDPNAKIEKFQITPDMVKDMPYMINPQYGNTQSNYKQQTKQTVSTQQIVNEFKPDMPHPLQQQRLVVQKDTINDMINLRDQYKEQVFRPGHNMPTMSLDELAEIEMADAMERQRKDQEMQAKKDMEDPDSEEVLERERKRVLEMDEWKDWNPKGKGNTKQM